MADFDSEPPEELIDSLPELIHNPDFDPNNIIDINEINNQQFPERDEPLSLALSPSIKVEADDEEHFTEIEGSRSLQLSTEQQRMIWHRNQANTLTAEAGQGEQHFFETFHHEDGEETASARLEKAKEQYEVKKAQGTLTLEDDIKLKKLQHAKDTQKRLRQSQQEYSNAQVHQENSLFFPDTEDLEVALAHENHVHDVDDVVNVQSADEVIDVNSGSTTGKAKGKSRIRTKVSKDKVTKKRARNKEPAAKGRRGRARGTRRDESLDITTILSHNVADQAQANQNAEPQPTFESTNKAKALAELIASIPQDQRDLYSHDRDDLRKATMKFNGRGAMKADGKGMWILKGMVSSLHHYQTIGVGMMRDRENQGSPNGGMLSDSMGLGKTVMQIANLVDGRPEKQSRGKATLVVAPAALAAQWLAEIKRHTAPETLKDCFIYRSKNDNLFTEPAQRLSNADVVITSYHEVSRSLPNKIYPVDLVTERAKQEWWEKHFEDKKGVLHQVTFHRIVLDEAQAIKNHTSRFSEAAWRLQGKYRWASSGTPVENSLQEFFAYFRFLRIATTGDFNIFRKNYCKRGSHQAIQRLQVMLNKIMIRRTHNDRLFGRPIIQLPPIKPVKTIFVSLNLFERSVYKIIKDRFMTKIQIIQNQNALKKSYTVIFVLLLRLRQFIAHIYIIQKVLENLLESEDLERLWELTRIEPMMTDDDNSHEMATHLKVALNHVQSITVQGERGLSQELQMPVVSETAAEVRRSVLPIGVLSQEFRKCLQQLHDRGQWEQANQRSLCSFCGQPPSSPQITSCFHMYCTGCLSELAFTAASRDEDLSICSECGIKFRKSETYAPQGFEEARNISASQSSVRGQRRSRRQPTSPEKDDIDWLLINGPILQSSKTRATVKQMQEWWDVDETVKIIVFTQWRYMIKIFERIFADKGWRYASFHGAMSFEARNAAIEKFTSDDKVKVFIAAMKAGGTGLNLVAGCRVILVDLWWNQSVEAQAYCRAFRIGQTRDVEIVRLAADNTIDIEIIKMQDRKTKEIDSAVEKKNRVGNLTTAELLKLFGPIQDENNGEDPSMPPEEPFIIVDDPYEEKQKDQEPEEVVQQNQSEDHSVIPDDDLLL